MLRKTYREFQDDQVLDIAAALTYYAVLSIFPATIALLSLLGLVGQGREAVDAVLEVLRGLRAGSIADTLEPTLVQLSATETAGLALVLGLAGALWSASGYVGAFGRALNRIYEVREGRPFWKLRPAMLLLTVVLLALTALALLGLVVSGPLAAQVGALLGLEETTVLVWDIAKWPVILLVVGVIVALLYWGTPNVRPPRFRWISVGAAVAILVWVVVSVGFGVYVANFSSYDKTYGSLAGAVVFLLWLWLTNLALLFGAELDAELERGRELEAGLPAEETIQLPARDTRGIEKAEAAETRDVEQGRAIREAAVRRSSSSGRS